MNWAKIFKGTNTPLGYETSLKKPPQGYSLDKAYQNQAPAGQIGTKTSRGAGRDGLKQTFGYENYYKIESGPQAAPAPAQPTYAPLPSPRPSTPLQPIGGGSTGGGVTPVPQPVAPPAPVEMTSKTTNLSNGSLSISSADSAAKKKNNIAKGTSQFKRNLKIMNINP